MVHGGGWCMEVCVALFHCVVHVWCMGGCVGGCMGSGCRECGRTVSRVHMSGALHANSRFPGSRFWEEKK